MNVKKNIVLLLSVLFVFLSCESSQEKRARLSASAIKKIPQVSRNISRHSAEIQLFATFRRRLFPQNDVGS
jgi:hypothetical protein